MSANRKARRATEAKARKGNGTQAPAGGAATPESMLPRGAVFIAVPTYDGKIDVSLAKALVDEVPLLLQRRWIAKFAYMAHNALVPAARNMLCDNFLADWWGWEDKGRRPFTDLLFIDADVTFEPGAIVRILEHDTDVVFGCPPMKTEDEQYPAEFVRDANECARPDPETGLIAMRYGPAGFLRIRRGVLQRMIEAGLAPEIVNKNYAGAELRRYRRFFHVEHVGTRYVGEDVYFYERVREMGVTVWMDPILGFDHSGTKRWRGNVGEYLTRLHAEQQLEADTQRGMREGIARRAREGTFPFQHAPAEPAGQAGGD